MNTFRFITDKHKIILIVAPNVRVAIERYKVAYAQAYISIEMIF